MMSRPFPPPWSVRGDGRLLIVRDGPTGSRFPTFLNSPGGSLFGYASTSLTNGLARTAAALGIRRAG
jgi:hypothetical protein